MNKVKILVKQLLEIPSTTDNPKALKQIIELCHTFLSQHPKLVVKDFPGQKPALVATIGDTTTPTIMLHGHLDVVPGNPQQYHLTEKDGKWRGRGVSDMKVACALMMQLMVDLANREELSGKLGLMLTTDEEVGGFEGSKKLAQVYQPSCFITGETTNLHLSTAAKGLIWLELKSTGHAAHAAYPWKGHDPIAPLLQSLQTISQRYPSPTSEAWSTTYSLTNLHAGIANNSIPQQATAVLDIRHIPEENPSDIITAIKKLVEPEIELNTLLQEPPVVDGKATVYAIKLAQAITQHSGQEAVIKASHGASDARFFSALGVPAFEFGPVGNGLHSEDEWLDPKSLERFYQILTSFVESVSRL